MDETNKNAHELRQDYEIDRKLAALRNSFECWSPEDVTVEEFLLLYAYIANKLRSENSV